MMLVPRHSSKCHGQADMQAFPQPQQQSKIAFDLFYELSVRSTLTERPWPAASGQCSGPGGRRTATGSRSTPGAPPACTGGPAASRRCAPQTCPGAAGPSSCICHRAACRSSQLLSTCSTSTVNQPQSVEYSGIFQNLLATTAGCCLTVVPAQGIGQAEILHLSKLLSLQIPLLM